MFIRSNRKLQIFRLGLPVLLPALSLLLWQCGDDNHTTEMPTPQTEEEKQEIALLDDAQTFFQASMLDLIPEEIAEEKIALGKKLFMDNRLSKDENISCNSCHGLKTYGVDNLPLSPGDTKELGGRNSPTVFYAFLHGMQFWDGRAKTVEEQAGGPILNPVEHNIPNEAFLEEKLRKIEEYRQMFSEVYPDSAEAITFATITDAIGAFERQLAPVSRFDEWMNGNQDALSQEEKKGLRAFMDNSCTTCHNGPALGGKMLQKFGLNDDYWNHTGSKNIDKGRFDITQNEKDMYLFKVPGLRNIEKTAPYFHDGSVDSLEDAVRIMGKLQLTQEMTEEDVQSITTFLKALTADIDDSFKE